MESSFDAHGFVDFANKHIQIHRMIASCTQEEILFSCCPEAFLPMLICETLKNDEIVIVRGCKRFVEYTGKCLVSKSYQKRKLNDSNHG